MKILYFDCFSGISGDMTLGALLDLGVDQELFKAELKKLNMDGYRLEISRSEKNGINGTFVTVHLDAEDHNHVHEDSQNSDAHIHSDCYENSPTHKPSCDRHADDQITVHQHDRHVHDHSHHHDRINSHNHACHDHHHHGHSHHHRSFKDIREIIKNSTISERAKDYAIKIFTKLAQAEGKIHGKPADQVHFHEVGAVDSIVDIVGTSILIDMLDVDAVTASPVPLGSGMVKCQHGLIPVPAPATLELLKGIPVYSNKVKSEIVTPTGAAILAALSDEFCDFPPMVINQIGYGMGKKDFEIPNCLRVCVGELRKK